MAGGEEFDVAVSFANENRPYVERVVRELKRLGVNAFYDADRGVDLWGKDLVAEFDGVYRHRSRAVVIFVSAQYARTMWTRHELRSALAGAIREPEVYVLPARFDDTDLPGLPDTVRYVDCRKTAPEELARMVRDKLDLRDTGPVEPAPADQPRSVPTITQVRQMSRREHTEQMNRWPFWVGVGLLAILVAFLIVVFFIRPQLTSDQRATVRFLSAILAGAAASTFLGGTAILTVRLRAPITVLFSATSGIAVFVLMYSVAPYWFTADTASSQQPCRIAVAPGSGPFSNGFDGSWHGDLLSPTGGDRPIRIGLTIHQAAVGQSVGTISDPFNRQHELALTGVDDTAITVQVVGSSQSQIRLTLNSSGSITLTDDSCRSGTLDTTASSQPTIPGQAAAPAPASTPVCVGTGRYLCLQWPGSELVVDGYGFEPTNQVDIYIDGRVVPGAAFNGQTAVVVDGHFTVRIYNYLQYQQVDSPSHTVVAVAHDDSSNRAEQPYH